MEFNEKAPKQARSRQTRDALLTALEELLKERPLEQIGVAEIARKADVSTASIYRRFEKKDGLVPALFDLYLQRIEEWYQQDSVIREFEKIMTQSLQLKEFIKANIRLLIKLRRDLEHLSRPMFIYGHMRPDLISDRVVDQLHAALESAVKSLEPYRDEIKKTDLARCAQFTAYFLQTAPYDYLLFRDRSVLPGLDLDDDSFADELTDFLYGYLTVR